MTEIERIKEYIAKKNLSSETVNSWLGSLITTIESLESTKEIALDSHKFLEGMIVQHEATIESQKEEIEKWRSLRPEVQWFAEQMEIVLRKNDHKGGWDNMSYRQLKSRLDEEVYEVELAYYAGRDIERLIHETADVANFAMMIADNSRIQEGDK